MVDACVSNQDVEPAIACDDGIDCCLCGTVVGHVEGRGVGLQSALTQSTRNCFERIGATTIGDDGRPCLRQSFSHGKPEAARGAGDERNSPIKRKQPIGGSHVVPQAASFLRFDSRRAQWLG
jgi:hypothetical protein